MEVEWLVGIAALVATAIYTMFFLLSLNVRRNDQSSESNRAPLRKTSFTMPATKLSALKDSEVAAIFSRLRLSRDDGCVITISFDMQVSPQ